MISLGQATLLIPDYDAAIAFYVEAVGFELRADVALGPDTRWVVVGPPGGGGTTLLLARARTPAELDRVGTQTGGGVSFFLHTDDFAADHARLRAAGVGFREEPRHEAYGTVAVFADPWGTTWDLIQPAVSG